MMCQKRCMENVHSSEKDLKRKKEQEKGKSFKQYAYGFFVYKGHWQACQ